MNEKQQQLTFDKGITNVPNDAICSDNTLEESVGMFYDDGEHKVIQKPEVFMTGLTAGQTLLYVHKVNNVDHYIIIDSGSIKWGTRNSQNVYVPAQEQSVDIVLMVANGKVSITSIGQTVIITDANGLHYFRFNNGGYENIEYPIPSLNLEAKLLSSEYYVATSTGSSEGILEMNDTQSVKKVSGKQKEYNDLVIGLYSENLKKIARSKGFSEPFLVRAALEMYDGSYSYISNPILLFPAVTENTRYYMLADVNHITAKQIIAATGYSFLFIRQTADYSIYSDIIKDVVIFASEPINIYKTNEDQPLVNQREDYSLIDSVSSEESVQYVLTGSKYRTYNYTPTNIPSGLYLCQFTSRCLSERIEDRIIEDIAETSIFYKIASIGLSPHNNFVDLSSFYLEDTLLNPTTQEALKYDDFYSRCKLVPKVTYGYNSRINLANVSRGYFSGFDFFLPLDQNDAYAYTFDVTIKTETDEVVVRHINSYTTQKQGIYFFYPDARAKHVKIYKQAWGGTPKLILDVDLKEHSGLNGAYYLAGLPNNTDEPTGSGISSIPAYLPPAPEMLYNQIIQSEVNNPWLFLATGYHSVGTGEIKGLSTVTQALSEGQFGSYPLLVFSENGIWAMSVDGTGLYSRIEPMSREVCSSPDSITQTDGAVFFVSKKGLMVVVGNDVRCVSEQLSGKTGKFVGVTDLGNFVDFLQTAIIAYDYRDSLLWIFDKIHDACWVYSIKSGTFGKYDFGSQNNVTNVVNYYPDYLLQNSQGVFSLLKRSDINCDANTYGATVITRPMKLENALALKSILQIKHITQFAPYIEEVTTTDPITGISSTETFDRRGSMTLKIYASNNLEDWVELTSLRGIPWKYYRFKFVFSDLKAIDTFAGSVLITQERRTDKLR